MTKTKREHWMTGDGKCTCPTVRKRKAHSLHRPGSAFSVDDAVNGLKHMADEHKCCEPFISAAIAKIEQLHEAANIALWIRDRIQDHGSFGAGLVEWRDIEEAMK